MSDTAPLVRAGEERPRRGRAVLFLLHALPLGWAAASLPWQLGSWFAVGAGALAALHALTAIAVLARASRLVPALSRAVALASLLFFGGVTWVVVSAALYLSALYRGIGPALAAALFCVWVVLGVFTVPIALVELRRVRSPRSGSLRARVGASATLAILATASLALVARSAGAVPIAPGSELERMEAILLRSLDDYARSRERRPEAPRAPLHHTVPARCPHPIEPGRLTLLASFANDDGKAVGACLQASSPEHLAERLVARLSAEASGRVPLVKLDLVTATHRLRPTHPLLDALKVRPAEDGVCAGERCLAPWQLVALDAFTRFQPFDAVRDARFGTSFAHLASALGVATPEGLVRIETRSTLWKPGRLTPLSRLRPPRRALDRAELERATANAERFLLRLQRDTPWFTYALDPFSGRGERGLGNLARQAGTALVLCELGRGSEAVRAAQRALSALTEHAVAIGELEALTLHPEVAALGHSALPLAAFATCRGRASREAQSEHDALLGGLGRLLLRMQAESGRFYPELDVKGGAPRGEHEALYAAGQAVLALVLLEEQARLAPSPHFPPVTELRRAIRSATRYYGTAYWPAPLRSLFFLEENWHCLAARAALASHADPDYERFCFEYVAFKGRFILEPEARVDPELVGGYTVSPVFPPHNTPTAGFGEALAAAITVKRARGLPTHTDEARLRRVLEFLIAEQRRDDSCFVCAPDLDGSFFESAASPRIRVDYVQHALAALGHGATALGLR
ncbi:MAG TPA: hypothetical protein VKY73_22965 [Polyangiaceae bacterium]|nr:hypothetical protein [Polyangiaceae bacterium]